MISHLLISLIDSEMSLRIENVFRSSKFFFTNYCFVVVFILNDFIFWFKYFWNTESTLPTHTSRWSIAVLVANDDGVRVMDAAVAVGGAWCPGTTTNLSDYSECESQRVCGFGMGLIKECNSLL